MKIDENYDGPTVAVLVRTMSTVFGIATTEVVSVHRDLEDAGSALSRRIIDDGEIGPGWRVVVVPAPFLAAVDPVQHPVALNTDDLLAIANVIDRNLPGVSTVGNDRAMPAARAVLQLVGQRMDDARSMARQDADAADRSRRITMSRALGVPLVLGQPAAWQVLAEHVRVLHDRADGREDPHAPSVAVLAAAASERETWHVATAQLRDALRPAQVDPAAVDAMSRTQLLDLVRSLVEVAGTPGNVRRAELVAELDPAHDGNAERLEDAARVVAGGQRNAPMTSSAWASYDGDLQEQWVEFAARVVTAYLQGGA